VKPAALCKKWTASVARAPAVQIALLFARSTAARFAIYSGCCSRPGTRNVERGGFGAAHGAGERQQQQRAVALAFQPRAEGFDGFLEAVRRERVLALLRDGLRANDAGENFLYVAMGDGIRCARVFVRLRDRDHAPADRGDRLRFGDRREVGADDRRVRGFASAPMRSQ
jgi:hypothetical protein